MTLGPIPEPNQLVRIPPGRSCEVQRHTLIKSSPALFPDNPVEALDDVVFRSVLAGDVHPALDGDVRISNRCRQELAERAEKESVPRHDPSPFLYGILQLLEDGVLEDWINHQDQRRQDTGKERRQSFLAEQ